MTKNATECAELSLYARLIAAQSEFPKIEQDKKANTFGGGRGYVYTDINSILNVITPILNRHGIGISHHLTTEGNMVGVKTVLFTANGEVLESPYFFADATGLVQKGVQSHGSLATYLRRYSTVSFLGIAYGVEDDDGYKAVEAHESHRSQKKTAPKPEAPAINFAELERSAKFASLDGLEAYKKFYEGLTGAEKRYLLDSGAHEKLKQEAMNG